MTSEIEAADELLHEILNNLDNEAWEDDDAIFESCVQSFSSCKDWGDCSDRARSLLSAITGDIDEDSPLGVVIGAIAMGIWDVAMKKVAEAMKMPSASCLESCLEVEPQINVPTEWADEVEEWKREFPEDGKKSVTT